MITTQNCSYFNPVISQDDPPYYKVPTASNQAGAMMGSSTCITTHTDNIGAPTAFTQTVNIPNLDLLGGLLIFYVVFYMIVKIFKKK